MRQEIKPTKTKENQEASLRKILFIKLFKITDFCATKNS